MSGELVDETPYSRKQPHLLFGHFVENLLGQARSVSSWFVGATLLGEYFNPTQMVQGDCLALEAFRQAELMLSLGLPGLQMQEVKLPIDDYPHGLSQAAVQAAIVVSERLADLQYVFVHRVTPGSPEAVHHHLFTGTAIDYCLGKKNERHSFTVVKEPKQTRLYAISPGRFSDSLMLAREVRTVAASDLRARRVLANMGQDRDWPNRAFARDRGGRIWRCLSDEPTYR